MRVSQALEMIVEIVFLYLCAAGAAVVYSALRIA